MVDINHFGNKELPRVRELAIRTRENKSVGSVVIDPRDPGIDLGLALSMVNQSRHTDIVFKLLDCAGYSITSGDLCVQSGATDRKAFGSYMNRARLLVKDTGFSIISDRYVDPLTDTSNIRYKLVLENETDGVESVNRLYQKIFFAMNYKQRIAVSVLSDMSAGVYRIEDIPDIVERLMGDFVTRIKSNGSLVPTTDVSMEGTLARASTDILEKLHPVFRRIIRIEEGHFALDYLTPGERITGKSKKVDQLVELLSTSHEGLLSSGALADMIYRDPNKREHVKRLVTAAKRLRPDVNICGIRIRRIKDGVVRHLYHYQIINSNVRDRFEELMNQGAIPKEFANMKPTLRELTLIMISNWRGLNSRRIIEALQMEDLETDVAMSRVNHYLLWFKNRIAGTNLRLIGYYPQRSWGTPTLSRILPGEHQEEWVERVRNERRRAWERIQSHWGKHYFVFNPNKFNQINGHEDPEKNDGRVLVEGLKLWGSVINMISNLPQKERKGYIRKLLDELPVNLTNKSLTADSYIKRQKVEPLQKLVWQAYWTIALASRGDESATDAISKLNDEEAWAFSLVSKLKDITPEQIIVLLQFDLASLKLVVKDLLVDEELTDEIIAESGRNFRAGYTKII